MQRTAPFTLPRTFIRFFDPPVSDLTQTTFHNQRHTPKPGDILILRTQDGKTLRRVTIASVTPIPPKSFLIQWNVTT